MAETASDAAADAASAVAQLETALINEKTTRESAGNEVSATFGRVASQDQARDVDITKLKQDVGIAGENAKRALHGIRRT